SDNALQAVEHAGLSRAHRRLLLLINGERSIHELARLTGHDREEVSRMLYELERAGLIRQL
ncbi:MAG: MarR family transcriptional regulator, partial [Chloroflexota bacterium]|nr:MarR family transcriptional regulator [Chloroflexota bacterium]